MKKIILLLLLTVLIVSGCVHTLTQEEIQDISKNDSKKDGNYIWMGKNLTKKSKKRGGCNPHK